MAQSNLAERYRAHRRAMELALELHCTPNEAKAELARREARARWEQTQRTLRAKVRPARAARPAAAAQPLPEQPWMMRD